jgi:hypothetical protein
MTVDFGCGERKLANSGNTEPRWNRGDKQTCIENAVTIQSGQQTKDDLNALQTIRLKGYGDSYSDALDDVLKPILLPNMWHLTTKTRRPESGQPSTG